MIEYDLLNRATRTATYRHRTELNRESFGLNTAVHPQNPQNQETFLRIREIFRIPKDYNPARPRSNITNSARTLRNKLAKR